MNILTLETTGAKGSAAIIDENGQTFMQSSTEKLNHLRELMPMISELLEKCQLQLDDIGVIAASEGPGSFTGIRIGVASARALAQTLGLKTIGVPTLETFLYNVPGYRGIVCPVFDARRNQVYAGAFELDESGRSRVIVPGNAYELDEFLEELKNAAADRGKTEMMFFGDGTAAYESRIALWGQELEQKSLNNDIRISIMEGEGRLQNAASAAKLARRLFLEGKAKPFQELKPVYMRKAEAERKLEERSK